jgi:hypothetical protein
MALTPEQLKLAQIFFPFATRKQMEVRARNTRFVHYTSAEVAVSILKNEEVWMRKSNTMNDFMEIEHGLSCLKASYDGEPGNRFKATLDCMLPGCRAEVEKRFNSWIPHFKADTYLTCVSEHLDSEDGLGRLSMWRAYGGAAGVAVVLNNTP